MCASRKVPPRRVARRRAACAGRESFGDVEAAVGQGTEAVELVAPGDAAALADALWRVCQDPTTWQRRSDAARAIAVERFDVVSNVLRLAKLLREASHVSDASLDH